MLLEQGLFAAAYEDVNRTARGAGCSVLVLVAASCDAIAACRILTVRPANRRWCAGDVGVACGVLTLLARWLARVLSLQSLFFSDNISYKIRPVAGYSDIVDANEDLIKDSESVRVAGVCLCACARQPRVTCVLCARLWRRPSGEVNRPHQLRRASGHCSSTVAE